MAYLKKHLLTHQIDTVVPCTSSDSPIDPSVYNSHLSIRQYQHSRYANIFPDLDKRHFNAFQEFYFHQNERMSAFKYVKHQGIDAYIKR